MQVQRLEQIAQQMGIDPNGEICMAMQGLVEEAQDLLEPYCFTVGLRWTGL